MQARYPVTPRRLHPHFGLGPPVVLDGRNGPDWPANFPFCRTPQDTPLKMAASPWTTRSLLYGAAVAMRRGELRLRHRAWKGSMRVPLVVCHCLRLVFERMAADRRKTA